MKYYYFIVEGPHDLAAIGKILKLKDFSEVRNVSESIDTWRTLIPNKYPFIEDKLDRIFTNRY